MNTAPPLSLTPAVVFSLLRKHRTLWIAPAIAGFFLAAVCSFMTPRTWSARQGLIIRSEAAGYASQRLGKFTDLSEMKTVQETMLELARSQSVLSAVLLEVGPSSSWGTGDWPSKADVASFRKRLNITPPGGAEFGNTEVFYVEVQDHDPLRAEKLVAALSNQLEHRLQTLREERAASMVHELQRSVSMAEASLSTEVERLAEYESTLGPQLGELRNLISSNGSQGSLEQQAAAVEQEIRGLETNRRKNELLLLTLKAAAENPERLQATPSSLLDTQPTLQRLKQGLVDAQIRTADLMGVRSANHPLVKAAIETQDHLRQQINEQAPEAIRGVEMELAVTDARKASLAKELVGLHATQSLLAQKRAEYSQLLSNVENQSRVVEEGRKQLADANAHQAGSTSASVLARIDNAEAGLFPIGPGRTTTAAAGGLLGLIAGLGAVFYFFAPRPDAQPMVVQTPAESPAPRKPVPARRAAAAAALSPTIATFVQEAGLTGGSVFVGS
ncbi:GumC family protein [Posidoniimonas polymericola]|uniref:GumC family protein n=1 Tax=Posidoniimonas polymericola TaxID=2528002 RepID=UPI0011B79549|nr:hypothetical protein [Posidoniimonas polymericola]